MTKEQKLIMVHDFCGERQDCEGCPINTDERARKLCDEKSFCEANEWSYEEAEYIFSIAYLRRENTGMSETARKIVVTLTTDSADSLAFIQHDIEQELKCASTHFDIVSVEEAEDAPAADVAPVVHAHWEDVSVDDEGSMLIASMFCPACNRWHNEVYHYGNPTEMAHYCPNCGAKMNERSEDEA